MKGGDVAKKKEAEDKFKEVQKIMKNDHVTKNDYAQCILKLTEAITLLQNNENKNETFNANLHAFRASIFMKTGQYQLALIDYYHAIRVDD
jgi:hypothetical protein